MKINDILLEIDILRLMMLELDEDEWEYEILRGRLMEMEQQLQDSHREIRVGWWE